MKLNASLQDMKYVYGSEQPSVDWVVFFRSQAHVSALEEKFWLYVHIFLFSSPLIYNDNSFTFIYDTETKFERQGKIIQV